MNLHAAQWHDAVSTAELIYDRAKLPPEDLQREALHSVEFLRPRRKAGRQERSWAAVSAAQLARQYAPEDALYDREQQP